MAHFFFRLVCSGKAAEIEEVDLPDRGMARREALQACGDLIRDIDGLHERQENWEMEVTGEDGRRVVVIRLTAESFPGD